MDMGILKINNRKNTTWKEKLWTSVILSSFRLPHHFTWRWNKVKEHFCGVKGVLHHSAFTCHWSGSLRLQLAHNRSQVTKFPSWSTTNLPITNSTYYFASKRGLKEALVFTTSNTLVSYEEWIKEPAMHEAHKLNCCYQEQGLFPGMILDLVEKSWKIRQCLKRLYILSQHVKEKLRSPTWFEGPGQWAS